MEGTNSSNCQYALHYVIVLCDMVDIPGPQRLDAIVHSFQGIHGLPLAPDNVYMGCLHFQLLAVQAFVAEPYPSPDKGINPDSL